MSKNKHPSLFWKGIIVLFALAGVAVAATIPKDPLEVLGSETNMVAPPPLNPYRHALAGAAIVEALNDNIFIGNPVPALVENIYVQVGDMVEEGQLLYTLDSREIRAQIEVDKAQLSAALTELKQAEDLYQFVQSLIGTGAISREEITTRRNNFEIAHANAQSAKETLNADEVRLKRLSIRAPKKGKILQHTIRMGNFLDTEAVSINTGEINLPVIMMGDVSRLQMRVDIDEQNAPRVDPGKPAVAYPKGLIRRQIPLKFLRIEPYVVPKRSLTGASDERVDTRVLQVIYTFESPEDLRVYVGQQFDVFIEADPLIQDKAVN